MRCFARHAGGKNALIKSRLMPNRIFGEGVEMLPITAEPLKAGEERQATVTIIRPCFSNCWMSVCARNSPFTSHN